MTEADALTDLDRALTATEAVVAGIRAAQWSAPTPCTELDVRAVLNHLVSGNLLFAALVRGEPLPDRGADQLGGDPLTAFQQAAGQLREAFAAPGVLESVYTAPFGTGPGRGSSSRPHSRGPSSRMGSCAGYGTAGGFPGRRCRTGTCGGKAAAHLEASRHWRPLRR